MGREGTTPTNSHGGPIHDHALQWTYPYTAQLVCGGMATDGTHHARHARMGACWSATHHLPFWRLPRQFLLPFGGGL
eukprot:scaffold584_cov338-Pavlova_lutheri.AAC.40